MPYFSHLCAASNESIPLSSVAHCPATVFYPDGTKDAGVLDGSGRIGESYYLGKMISQVGGSQSEDVNFDLSKLQINLFLGDPRKSPLIQSTLHFKSLAEFKMMVRELDEGAYQYRAFNLQCPTTIKKPDGSTKVLDHDVYLYLDSNGKIHDAFALPDEFFSLTAEQLMDQYRSKVVMENTPLDIFDRALASVKMVKSKYALETDTYDSLRLSAPCPHQGYFYPCDGAWLKPEGKKASPSASPSV